MLCTPFYPMVLLIIIPFLNGYLFGNIPYFQTNPYRLVVKLSSHGSCQRISTRSPTRLHRRWCNVQWTSSVAGRNAVRTDDRDGGFLGDPQKLLKYGGWNHQRYCILERRHSEDIKFKGRNSLKLDKVVIVETPKNGVIHGLATMGILHAFVFSAGWYIYFGV